MMCLWRGWWRLDRHHHGLGGVFVCESSGCGIGFARNSDEELLSLVTCISLLCLLRLAYSRRSSSSWLQGRSATIVVIIVAFVIVISRRWRRCLPPCVRASENAVDTRCWVPDIDSGGLSFSISFDNGVLDSMLSIAAPWSGHCVQRLIVYGRVDPVLQPFKDSTKQHLQFAQR
jgi:hypothetical protein